MVVGGAKPNWPRISVKATRKLGHFRRGAYTLEVIASDLPRRELRLVLAWAEVHTTELAENWLRAREGATLKEIEPLR